MDSMRTFRRLMIVLTILAVASAALAAQATKDAQVLAIRQEFQRIQTALPKLEKVEAYWSAGESYWNNVSYTAWLDSRDRPVLLSWPLGEEGYWSNTDVYFKDGAVMFIFIRSGEPDGTEKQERIYFWNNAIVEAFIKRKAPDEARAIDALPNRPHTEILTDPAKAAALYRSMVKEALAQFAEAQRQPRN